MGCAPNELELTRRKNVIFDEFIRPKPTQLKGIPIGKKRTIRASDLEPYKHLEASNLLKLTSKGFLLFKFSFDEIRMPTT